MKLPFDQYHRFRLYLVRHGEAAASAGKGDVYGDQIALTPQGIGEAEAMGTFLADVAFDVALCSTIARAAETAEIVLRGRALRVESWDRLREIEGDFAGTLTAAGAQHDIKAAFAYGMWQADQPDARFYGGDLIADYMARAAATITDLLRSGKGDRLLIVSHSGFLRAALSWALDAGPLAMAAFEQDSCCLNILDIDVDPAGVIRRKHVRLANFTPVDPTKNALRLTNGEVMASRLFAAASGSD